MGILQQSGECADAAALYRRKFGWPCTAVGHAVWMLAGEALDAVDVPEYFGPGMLSALRGTDPPHPAIEVPGDADTWRFLVRPATPSPGLVAELTRCGAVHLGHAEVLELPPTRVRGGELRWLTGPEETAPTLAQVVAALVSVVLAETERSPREHAQRQR